MKHAFFLLLALLVNALFAVSIVQAQTPVITQRVSLNPDTLALLPEGHAIAVDAAGNQYVTGYFGEKIQVGNTVLSINGGGGMLLAKRDGRTGAWLWAVQSYAPGNLLSSGIAVDTNGGVFLTGEFADTARFTSSAPGVSPVTTKTVTSAGGLDAFVARFDAATGACTWVVSAGGTGDDEASDLALDSTGNVYIIGGWSFGSTAPAFTTSATGTSIVTTTTLPGAPENGVFVARFVGVTGACTWAMPLHGNVGDFVQISVDLAGNVLITGGCNTTAVFTTSAFGQPITLLTLNIPQNQHAVFLAKLNGATGACIWATTLTSTDTVEGDGVAVDGFGRITLTGNFSGAISFPTSVPGSSPATTITRQEASQYGMFVAQFSATGACTWAISAESQQESGSSAVAVDSVGNAYVTGRYQQPAQFKTSAPGISPVTTITLPPAQDVYNLFVARFDHNTGACIWAKEGGSNRYHEGVDIAVDSQGQPYVLGQGYGSGILPGVTGALGTTCGLFVAGLEAATGNWETPAQTACGGNSKIKAMSFDGAGNQYVTGSFSYTLQLGPTLLIAAGDEDIFVAKRDTSTGTWLWAVRAGGRHDDHGNALQLDASGNVYIAGQFAGPDVVFFTSGVGTIPPAVLFPVTSDSITGFVARFDGRTGACTWLTQIAGSGNSAANGIGLNSQGSLFITGAFKGVASLTTWTPASTPITSATLHSSGGADTFVARLEAGTGTASWAVAAGGGGDDAGLGLALDSQGYALVVGQYTSITSFASNGASHVINLTANGHTDGFVARFVTANGNCTWAIPIGGTTEAATTAVSTDTEGHAVITGWFDSLATLTNSAPGQPIATTSLFSTGKIDTFVAKLDVLTGACSWSVAAGGLGNDYSNAVALDSIGNIYVAGTIDTTALFIGIPNGAGPAPTTSVVPGYYGDGFVARFDGSTGANTGAITLGSSVDGGAFGITLTAKGMPCISGFANGRVRYLSPIAGMSSTTPEIEELTGCIVAVHFGPAPVVYPLRPAPGQLLAYPNPAATAVQVVQAVSSSTSFNLIDSLGRIVRTWPAAASSDTSLSLTGLLPGIYVLRCGGATTRLAVM